MQNIMRCGRIHEKQILSNRDEIDFGPLISTHRLATSITNSTVTLTIWKTR